MKPNWLIPATILTGICAVAVSSFAQTYTVSAKPGAVNYIQGEVSINGDPVWTSNLKSTFLNASDVIQVKNGKAEVLLAPGAFLRLGEDSQVRMVKPSLIETQIEAVSGESMVEVDDLVPGSSISVLDHGVIATLDKPGLYRFTGSSVAALEGKAEVVAGDRKITVKKDKELLLGDALVPRKVDLSQPDDLYVWSNTRAQYNAAATYAGSTQAYQAGGYGYGAFSSPGWYWNSPFNSYMWMPGNGAYYSPFGWGFYGPGVVSFAPVIMVPYGYYGNGYYGNGYQGGGGSVPVKTGTTTATSTGTKPVLVRPMPAQMTVPVNPRNVGVASFQGTTPASFAAARMQMQQAADFYGLRTVAGAPAANLQSGHTFSNMRSASQAATTSSRMSSGRYSGGGGGNVGGGGGFAGGSAAHSSGGFGGGAAAHSSGGMATGGHSK
jgi:hypothetical protein